MTLDIETILEDSQDFVDNFMQYNEAILNEKGALYVYKSGSIIKPSIRVELYTAENPSDITRTEAALYLLDKETAKIQIRFGTWKPEQIITFNLKDGIIENTERMFKNDRIGGYQSTSLEHVTGLRTEGFHPFHYF